jgi:tRNA threonylcarbamoyladenosine biosynthesis protein TsaB
MLVLSLDTTTKAGGMALADGDRLLEARTGDASLPHASRLPAGLIDLLTAHGHALGDVDLYAVAAGPGSFTGLRIGIATMQGLAFASGRPLVGVSALEALAVTAAISLGAGSHAIAAWMDAQRGEVFAAAYRVRIDADGAVSLTSLALPVAASADEIARRWRSEADLTGLVASGDGALRYRSVVAAHHGGLFSGLLESAVAIAPAVALLAVRAFADGGSYLPHAIRPIYVRRPDAELARERRRAPA